MKRHGSAFFAFDRRESFEGIVVEFDQNLEGDMALYGYECGFIMDSFQEDASVWHIITETSMDADAKDRTGKYFLNHICKVRLCGFAKT